MGVKYFVNEAFFSKWSPVMAYVLGYLYADGSLEDASYLRGKYIRVTSVDKDTIIKIRRWLKSEHAITEYKSQLPNRKTRYLLRIGSHRLYKDLVFRGLYPNKSLTIHFPAIPPRFVEHFLRGYFDGDGCVYLEMAKGKTKEMIIKRLSVIFTSGSKLFLEGIAITFKKHISLDYSRIYDGQRAFQLRYSTLDSIKIFKFLYYRAYPDMYLPRKLKIFKKYFKLRPVRADKKVLQIVEKLGHVVK